MQSLKSIERQTGQMGTSSFPSSHSLVPFCPFCLPNKPVRKKTGFTLIELLVVVAIIGILFAIALPVFGNAGRKDTQRAAQQVATTLRLARQHAIAKRQWTFVIFPNQDSDNVADAKAINSYKKCLRSYAVIAATNNMDNYRTNGPVVNGVMKFEFVTDWKYLPEGVYFDDSLPGKGKLSNNYVFGSDGSNGYDPDAPAADQFQFPYDPADPNSTTKRMKMSAVLFKPNGRYFMMQQTGKIGSGKFWVDREAVRLYLTSSHYYEFDGNSLNPEPIIIPGTNTMIQFQAKTGMVKILDGD